MVAARRGARAESTLAFVALGSNVDRVPMIRGAVAALGALGRVEDCSHLYETLPAYVEEQPRFLNAVCSLRTTLPPHDLLRALKDIERRFGRDASSAIYGPRCLDLDLLMYGAHVGTFSSAPQLELPHPRIAEREFVCRPLHDVAPDATHPSLGVSVATLLERIGATRSPRVFPVSDSRIWDIDSGPTRIMGVLNVTPDRSARGARASSRALSSTAQRPLPPHSFSDGGRYSASVSAAVARAEEMVSDGADVIDVGGESTRPGAPAVPACEEMERVIPVIAAIREHLADAVAISVDTRSAAVAAAAVEAGADIVNDVSAGLADASMLPTVARLRVPIVLMHMRGAFRARAPDVPRPSFEFSVVGGRHARGHAVARGVRRRRQRRGLRAVRASSRRERGGNSAVGRHAGSGHRLCENIRAQPDVVEPPRGVCVPRRSRARLGRRQPQGVYRQNLRAARAAAA